MGISCPGPNTGCPLARHSTRKPHCHGYGEVMSSSMADVEFGVIVTKTNRWTHATLTGRMSNQGQRSVPGHLAPDVNYCEVVIFGGSPPYLQPIENTMLKSSYSTAVKVRENLANARNPSITG